MLLDIFTCQQSSEKIEEPLERAAISPEVTLVMTLGNVEEMIHCMDWVVESHLHVPDYIQELIVTEIHLISQQPIGEIGICLGKKLERFPKDFIC